MDGRPLPPTERAVFVGTRAMIRAMKPKGIPDKLNVLLVGGGGREHALAWKLKKSKRVANLWTTHPGNPGIAGLARALPFDYSLKEMYRLEQFCRHESINLVVVGPEDPLAAGMVDALTNDQTAVFGPTREGAQLEADKAWSKQLMRGAMIPTGSSRVYTDVETARTHLRARDEMPVMKATGLAAGKGVFIPDNLADALEALDTLMVDKAFGEAGAQVMFEERLEGPEVSVFALTDGRSILVLDACQDHKRIGEGDTGPNTGGMGAYCPARILTPELFERVQHEILVPTVDALRREGIEYRGVIYAGLMLTPAGPKVLEYNVRFGDPECQCLMRRIDGDLGALLYATATGQLESVDVSSHKGHVCCVVLASDGYPGKYANGIPIEGIEEAERVEGVTVFHAGTKREKGAGIVTAGGRVLNVVALADTIEAARERAYEACDRINFAGKTLRRDIAHQAVGAPT